MCLKTKGERGDASTQRRRHRFLIGRRKGQRSDAMAIVTKRTMFFPIPNMAKFTFEAESILNIVYASSISLQCGAVSRRPAIVIRPGDSSSASSPRGAVSWCPAIGGRQEDGRVGWSSVNPRYAISRCPAIGGRQEDTRVAWSTVRVSSFHGGQRSAAGRTVVPKMSSPHGVTKHVR